MAAISQGRKSGARYQTPTGVEGEFQPHSRKRVLRNRQGITLKSEMDQLEYEALIQVQGIYLETIEQETRFTADLIRTMHRDWLGALYSWAGNYRTVEMAKGGFSWPPAYLVDRNMLEFENGLLSAKSPCKPGDPARILRDTAEVHAELLLIHPFREGNGRLARWLSELMILQAGLPLPVYQFTGRGSIKERERYLNAVKRGYVKDYRPLVNFFSDAVERGRLAEAARTRTPANSDDSRALRTISRRVASRSLR
jgi:cell filamentation protein